MVNEPYNYVRATPRDYQVIDIFSPSEPTLVATIAQVKHIGLPVSNLDPASITLWNTRHASTSCFPKYDHPTEWALI
jgi:hypothetical protein